MRRFTVFDGTTPREARVLDVAAVALVVGGTALVTCAFWDSIPGMLAALIVTVAGWIASIVVLHRVINREHDHLTAALDERRAQLEALHAVRRAELAELRRRMGLPPRDEEDR